MKDNNIINNDNLILYINDQYMIYDLYSKKIIKISTDLENIIDNIYDCYICFETFDKNISKNKLKCGHNNICCYCYSKLLKSCTNPLCPICRCKIVLN